MSQFEYVSVAVALIYALVVGRLLTGLAVGLEGGRRYPIHAAWVAALLLACVAQWWTIWRTRDIEWSALRFLWILIPPSLMYVGAIVLVGLQPLGRFLDDEGYRNPLRVPEGRLPCDLLSQAILGTPSNAIRS